MNGTALPPSSGTLEELLDRIEEIPSEAMTFDLWVPEALTYRGEPITLEAVMAIVVDQLLALELFPDDFDDGVGGRTYHYRREPTGAPAPAEPPRRETANWLVRALRRVGIGSKRIVFEPGQVWRYAARKGEERSRVHILRIDTDPTLGEIVHIAISGLQIPPPVPDEPVISMLGHVPISRAALARSGLALESNSADIPDFEEGYDMWREAFEAGDAGVFSIPVAEVVAAMEQTIRGGAVEEP